MASPVLARGVEPADLGEPVEKRLARTVIDAARAVSLYVAVPADGARPRSFAADVAPQQQQVDDLAHRVDAVLVLREAQAPGDDYALRLPSPPTPNDSNTIAGNMNSCQPEYDYSR